jgi:hypothetical protein
MPRILVLIMVGIIILVSLASLGRPNFRSNLLFPKGILLGLAFSGFFAPFLMPVLAGSWPGNEFGWGTIRMVLSRRPNRMQQSLAGLVMVLVFVVIALLVSMIVGCVIGLLFSSLFGHGMVDNTDIQNAFGLNVLKVFVAEIYTVGFYAIVAYAAGTVFRSAAAGIGIGIGSWIAEEVLRGIFIAALGGTWAKIAQHFPNSYTSALPGRLLGDAVHSRFFTPDSNIPGIGESIIVLGIYMAALIAITLYAGVMRDVTA